MKHKPAPVLDEQGLPVPNPDFEAEHAAAIADYFAASETEFGDDELDMFAVDPGEWRALSAVIPGLLVHSAGGLLPFQSEGTLHGLDYYFRYRHGTATLKVGGTDEDLIRKPLYIAHLDYGNEYAGTLDGHEFAHLMIQLVSKLERASFCYQFEGSDVHVTEDKEFFSLPRRRAYPGWGHSPAEAFAALSRLDPTLTHYGFTDEEQRLLYTLRAPNRIPLNTDDRVYPDPEPVFEVLV